MDIKTAIQPVSAEALQKNAGQVQAFRHTVALAGGAAAGALRLESLQGFGFFLGLTIVASVMMLAVSRGTFYFTKPLQTIMFEGVMSSLPGYVLGWSLVYSLVET